MKKVYTDTLPKDYFDNLYGKVSKTLSRGENVCISVMYGQSNKTLYSFLFRQITKEKLFNKILTYDPLLTDENPVYFTKRALRGDKKSDVLIILRFFEKIPNRRTTLDKLKSLQDQNRNRIAFLAIADHSVILNPLGYTANTTVFFSDCVYVPPFNFEQTKKMIKTLRDYYNWKISAHDYRKIYALSGGVGRIIKYICKELYISKVLPENIERLANNQQILFELNYLTKMLIKTPLDKVHVLGLTDNDNKIKSQLLREYFKNYRSEIIEKIYPNISVVESRILSSLLEYGGGTISIDKISQISKMSDENFSLWAIYKTVSRLRSKVKKDFKIKSVRGLGYLLVKRG
ncbi:MAG TPA: helix-turn-helix domain-containing protein [Patescibacteria group bacterium]|nr:helix-turn-helix domain-containing protein [Patescibacteria group bacterium]